MAVKGKVGFGSIYPFGDQYTENANLLRTEMQGFMRLAQIGDNSEYLSMGFNAGAGYLDSKGTLFINSRTLEGVSIGDYTAPAAGTILIVHGGASVKGDLTVCDKITSQEVEVKLNTGWCDYVFAEDYDLKPLAEVDAYIKQNHHLPGIPAASVVETEGLKLADMQVRMMEKIEELTLYTIQQQQEIEALKAELNAVRN